MTNYTAKESVLTYLSDPAVVAALGAFAVTSAYYLYSRPTPQPCPVDANRQSYELPGEDGARMSSLSTEIIERLFDDVTTAHEAFMRGVNLSGDKPCLGFRSSPGGPYAWLTYNEVLERSFNTGSGLVEIGCHPADSGHTFVGVYAPNRIEWVFVGQACNLYSMSLVPLYDTLGPDACVFIVNQAQMTTIVCDESKLKVLLEEAKKCPKLKNIVKIGAAVTDEEKVVGDEMGVKIISFTDVEERGRDNRQEKKPPKPDDIAVVCYTSGTTGNPKGVMLTHRNITAGVAGIVTTLEKCGLYISDSEVHLSYLPMAHMFEQISQVMCFMYGAKIGFFSGNVRNILDDVRALKPTLFVSVPRVLNRVYDMTQKEVSSSPIKRLLFNLAMRFKRAELEKNIVRRDSVWDYLVFRKIQDSFGGRLRMLFSATAPLRDDVMIFLRCALGCQVLEGYGQTETTVASSLQLVGDQTYGHVGPPMPCNKIKLVDVPDMDYYAKDGKGEVCFFGPNVFQGYLFNEEKTKEAIDKDGWLHSGDIGEWLPNGTLKLIDRKKNLFKLSQGEYIAPEKVETVYTQCSMVQQIFVYGDSKKSTLVAIVVPEPYVVEKWANKNGVEGDINSLCNNEQLKKAILDQMTAEAKREKLRSFEQVKAISLSPEMWTVGNNLLTPTLKPKRQALKTLFAKTFEDLYSTLPE
ncbi:long-chain-fatty-acid--CoA ligase 1-like [Montipora foliosa]|uniref:long-chain-fatty-acid--CoA ligase 1-like n=1 Tax=Montipora foliosa TaxID=591990 RepID=UPI0035F15829